MDYHTELYGILKQHKLQEAIHLTGKLIYDKNIDIVQKTWIRCIASIGEYTNVCFSKWQDTCDDIAAFITVEQFDIKDAFKITTKLCILFQNGTQYIVVPKLTIPLLRAKTIGFFAEDNKLSDAGIKLFQSILPNPINEREFCLKLISGLVRLWNGKKGVAFRDAIEYLCRKDYVIESLHSETDCVIATFIWDFLKILQPELTTPLYAIYKTGYKKKDKLWRNNLLYGIHNFLIVEYSNVLWSERENTAIKHAIDMSSEFWSYIISEMKEDVVVVPDKMAIFENYRPKIKEDVEEYGFPVIESQTIKSVSVKHKKRDKERGREREKDRYVDDERLLL